MTEQEQARRTNARKELALKLIPILQNSLDMGLTDEAYIISAFISAMMIGQTAGLVAAIAKAGKP